MGSFPDPKQSLKLCYFTHHSTKLSHDNTKIEKFCNISQNWCNSDKNVSTVKSCFMDTRLKWTPHYYRKIALSLGKESPYNFSKFHSLNRDTPLLIWKLSITPSVSELTEFNCTQYRWFSQWCHQIVKSKKQGFTNSYLH